MNSIHGHVATNQNHSHFLLDHSFTLQSLDGVDDVGTLCAYLTSLLGGSSRQHVDIDLTNRGELKMHTSNGTAHDRWASEIVWPQQQAITEENIKQGLFRLRGSYGNTAVCCMSRSHSTLFGANLDLHSDLRENCLVLDCACKDLTISGASFQGMLSPPRPHSPHLHCRHRMLNEITLQVHLCDCIIAARSSQGEIRMCWLRL